MPFRPSRSPVTTALLTLIAAIFFLEWFAGALQDDLVLRRMGAITPTMLADGEWWRAVAAMFLHGGFLHWLANSWALYQLGSLYEAMFGSGRFTIVYFVTGIAASVASSLFMHPYGIGVGASGAVLGILGAFIFSVLRSPQFKHQPWTKSLINQLVFWAFVNLALGLSVKNIDNVAHIAGLVTGLALGFIPHRVPPPPPGELVIDVTPRESGPQ
jgi:rhomboid protease GluP